MTFGLIVVGLETPEGRRLWIHKEGGLEEKESLE